METCIFCSLANGTDRKFIWESETIAVFPDISPKAPVHVLVVPKAHVQDLDHLTDRELAADLLMAIKEAAKAQGVAGAYRVRLHNGRDGGQTVDHLHFQVLGGDKYAD